MKTLVACFCFGALSLGAAAPLHAQLVVLKTGQTAAAKNLKREGQTLLNTVNISGREGQVGYAVADIDHIELPEPPQLGQAEQAILVGKPAEALPLLDPLINAYYPLRDIKGAYWAPAAMLKSAALQSLGKRDEATVLLTGLSEYTLDPRVAQTARARLAGILALGGKSRAPQAVTLADGIIGSAEDSKVLAEAWLAKGRALFALGDYDRALDAFLRLPVFYDDTPASTAQAMLGSGRCYVALKDIKRAARTFTELQDRFSATPEAAEAKKEVEKGGEPMAAIVKQVQEDKAEAERRLKEASKA